MKGYDMQCPACKGVMRVWDQQFGTQVACMHCTAKVQLPDKPPQLTVPYTPSPKVKIIKRGTKNVHLPKAPKGVSAAVAPVITRALAGPAVADMRIVDIKIPLTSVFWIVFKVWLSVVMLVIWGWVVGVLVVVHLLGGLDALLN